MSNLPVFVFIHGGAFVTGSSQRIDGESFVATSMNLGSPIIAVTLNYRLNVFGFLASKDLAESKSTNLGLLDQRLALKWY